MSSKIFATLCRQSFIFRNRLQSLILQLSVSDCDCSDSVCVAGLSSQQWGQKKAAAKALADLAEAGGDALPPTPLPSWPHSSRSLSLLLLLPPVNHCDFRARTMSCVLDSDVS